VNTSIATDSESLDSHDQSWNSAGKYLSPAPPFRFSGSRLQSGPKVAGLGEHTERVLVEAGFNPEEIKALR